MLRIKITITIIKVFSKTFFWSNRSAWGPWIQDKIFMLVKMLAFLLPKNTQIFLKLFSPQWADFKPYQMLAELPCEVMVFSRQGSRITITNHWLVINLLSISSMMIMTTVMMKVIMMMMIIVTVMKVMYDDKAVSSARWHGVKGLGTELVRSIWWQW